MNKCPHCAEGIEQEATSCKSCKTNIVENSSAVEKTGKQIQETKCTCQACEHVWYYGKQDVKLNKANALSNASKSMMCCGGCAPALLIPDKKVVDFNKCPKCNSAAIKKEEVTYEV